jgi:hypothetical protein
MYYEKQFQLNIQINVTGKIRSMSENLQKSKNMQRKHVHYD